MNYFSSEFTEETLIGSNCNKVTVKDCYILRISYVYVTYILRILYLIDSGKKGKHKEKARKWQG